MDHTQFDKKDAHFDASSKPDNPKWSMVTHSGIQSMITDDDKATKVDFVFFSLRSTFNIKE